MKPLFDDTPMYDPHVVSIVSYMLEHLRNNSPKPTSNVYKKVASFVQEIHEGTFIFHNFKYSNETQYNLEGNLEKVKSCKGSWQTTRQVIIDSISHLKMAESKEYMPFNKRFLEGITFGTYFEGNSRFNPDGSLDSYFMKFVNEPKKSFSYNADLAINKIKSELSENIKISAEAFCKKWLKIKHVQLAFWKEIEDFQRWLNTFKKTYSKIYNEFILGCEDGNPFADLSSYIIKTLQSKEGSRPVINAYYFKLSNGDSGQLEGMFRNWLKDGIKNGKFNSLKYLPKGINEYYTDESFENKNSKKVEKKIVDAEDLPIF